MSPFTESEEILETLTQQTRILPNQLVGENGDLNPLDKMTRDQSRAIAEYVEGGYRHLFA